MLEHGIRDPLRQRLDEERWISPDDVRHLLGDRRIIDCQVQPILFGGRACVEMKAQIDNEWLPDGALGREHPVIAVSGDAQDLKRVERLSRFAHHPIHRRYLSPRMPFTG
jgi:hypothetical protein